jgi:hypothetical protein
MSNKVTTGGTEPGRGKRDAPTTSTYFLSLTVENIRCFGPEQRLDLSDGKGRPAQWTIILGENGVGKTTLLQSLVALTPVVATFEWSLCPRAYTMGKEFPLKKSPGWAPFRYTDETPSRISTVFCGGHRLTDEAACEKTADFSLEGDGELGGWLGATYLNFRETGIGDLWCFAYGASRRMGETSLSGESKGDRFESLFTGDAELLNAEEWLLQADYAAHATKDAPSKERAERRRDEIRRVLVEILPDVEDIRIAPLGENQLKPHVEVKTPYGWVSIKDLSLGYKTLMAWVVDFASSVFDQRKNSPNPLAEPAVVLVDEIDLHLHPKWQRTLMGYLSERFPNTQFIATAHSPLVVQTAQDANIVLLRREGDHVVIENNVEAVRNWRVDQILTSDLFGLESARPPETEKLLEERAKILSKAKLTKKDRGKLKKLEAEIGSIPTGETPEDIEAMDVIRRAAERLKAEGY